MHGLRIADAIDPAKQHLLHVPPPVHDYAQEKLDRAKAAYRKTYPNAEAHEFDSKLWRVELDEI